MSNPPSTDVVRAFGKNDTPQPLAGGQVTSYLVGDVVLKPVDDNQETIWLADLMNSVVEDGFRVPRPVKTMSGEWIYEGWKAFTYVPGKEEKSRWKEKIAISRRFHKALSPFKRPNFLDTATHPWAIADRMIWEETPLEYGAQLVPVIARLKPLLKPINIHSQLIHGDMSGNILFYESLPPAIIDLSPYWRPAEYPTAVIVVDSIVWENAPDSLLDEIENTFEMNQLLVRAAMWRIKTTEEFIQQYGKGSLDDVFAYKHLIDLLTDRIVTENKSTPEDQGTKPPLQ